MRPITLSLILPNRGRSRYLDITLQNLSEIEDSRVEILILENSLPEHSKLELHYANSNFQVEYASSKLSMTQNWFRGLKLAKGDWLAFVGSDDGIICSNLSLLLDFLDVIDSNVVTTHPIYFQYPLESKSPWADIPVQSMHTWNREIRYLSRLAVLFPSFKLDLPVPYNRSVVRRRAFDSLLETFDDIPAVSPDDFLGQYVAQKCRRGIYLELPVFIHGGSERSNGLSAASKSPSEDSQDFLRDANRKYGELLNKFGIGCSFAMAFEHFSSARKVLDRKKQSKFVFLCYSTWISLFCQDLSHHKHYRIFLPLKPLLSYIHLFTFRILRKIWQFSNFGASLPVKNSKKEQPIDMDILKLAHLLSK